MAHPPIYIFLPIVRMFDAQIIREIHCDWISTYRICAFENRLIEWIVIQILFFLFIFCRSIKVGIRGEACEKRRKIELLYHVLVYTRVLGLKCVVFLQSARWLYGTDWINSFFPSRDPRLSSTIFFITFLSFSLFLSLSLFLLNFSHVLFWSLYLHTLGWLRSSSRWHMVRKDYKGPTKAVSNFQRYYYFNPLIF